MDRINRVQATVGLVIGCLVILSWQPLPAQATPEVEPTPSLRHTSSSIADLNATTKAHVQAVYNQLPLYFEANRGQADPQVKFVARGHGYTIFLTDTKAVLALRQPHNKPAALQMELVSTSSKHPLVGLEKLSGTVHYLRGSNPAMWHTDIPTYAKVYHRSVYPGIDLVYYGNHRQLEYDFLVAPGGDPRAITLRFKGHERLDLGAEGELVLHTAEGPIRLQRPFIYQEVNGVKQAISGGYLLKSAHQVGFQVGAYDADRPLVIDPVAAYSTLLGGAGDELSLAIAVDGNGHAYVTGRNPLPRFPHNPRRARDHS